jgi:hypothetical protein
MMIHRVLVVRQSFFSFLLALLGCLAALAQSPSSEAVGSAEEPSAAGQPNSAVTPGHNPADPPQFPEAPFPDTPRSEDPIPLRRLRVTPEQLPAVLKQLDLGPVRRMSREELEQQLRAARQILEEARRLPFLSDLRLTAVLEGNDLIGQAECEILNPGTSPRMMVLEPLRVALSGATWSDGRPAVVGTPTGSGPVAVWVERSGSQVLRLDWSAAGMVTLDERRFELRWPAATTALLELDLPAELVPTAGGDTLVTGPFPASNPRQQRWRIRFSGRSRLDLSIRPATTATPITAAESRCRFELQGMNLTCAYEFDLRPVRGNISSWTFHLDPSLRVLDVISTPRSTWTVQAPSSKHGPLLHVTLPPTSSAVRLLIQAVSPLPPSGKLTLPFVRVEESLLLREAVDLRLAPEWKLRHFTPGDYRLIQASVAPDQTHQLQFQGTWLPVGASRPSRQPPLLEVIPAEASVGATEEYLTWHLQGATARLTARIRLQVKRGPLFQFRCRYPEGYELRRLTAGGEALLTHVDPKERLLTLEWLRPVPAGQAVEWQAEWVARDPMATSGTSAVPFPAITPLDVGERNGLLAIVAAPPGNGRAIPGPGTEKLGWLDWDFALPPPQAHTVLRYRGGDVRGYWLPASPSAVEPPAALPTAPAPSPARPPASAPHLPLQDTFLILLAREEERLLVVAGATILPRAAAGEGGELTALPVTLDPSLHLEAIGIEGQWLSPTACSRDEKGRWLIPLPATETPIRVILRGHYPVRRYGLWSQLTPPLVQWDEQAPELYHLFLPRNVLPLSLAGGQQDSSFARHFSTLAEILPTDLDGSWWTLSATAPVWTSSTEAATALALVVAGVALAAIWFFGNRRLLILAIIGLAASGLAVVPLVPRWWQHVAVTGCGLTLLAALALVGLRRLLGTAMALLAAAFVLSQGTFWPFLQAQGPAQPPSSPAAATTVLLLPPDAQGREEVLVPLSLGDQLARLRPSPPSWILTSAHYDVILDGVTARVEARWVVHVLDRPETPFLLPLGDARLESVRVHDTVGYPLLLRPGVYALDLPGKGRQEVRAQFVLSASGNVERELRFGAIECPQTTLTVRAQRNLRQLYFPGRLGRWKAEQGAPARQVQTELGMVRQVVLRWREEGSGTAQLRLREAALWDLSPHGAELTAAYWLEILGGSLTQLDLQIPDDLELLHLAIRSPEGSEGSVLRNWSLAPPQGGWRLLRIDWRSPTTGRWLLVLQAAPRFPTSRSPVLRFPRISQPGVSETDTFYALRLRDTSLESLQRHGLIDFSADALFQFFSSVPELRLDPAQTLRVFRPLAPAPAELRPTLRLPAELSVQAHTTWDIAALPARSSANPGSSPRSLLAFATGQLRWKDSPTPGYLTFTLPGVTVREIRGPDVAEWSVSQGVVHIWFKRPITEGTVQWYGTFHPPAGTPFDLPLPRPLETALWHEEWQVRPEEKLLLTWERLRGWTPKEPPDAAAPGYTASPSRQLPPLPRLQVQPPAPPSR